MFAASGILVFIILREGSDTFRSFLRMGWPGWFFTLISITGTLCFITSLGLTSVAHVAIIAMLTTVVVIAQRHRSPEVPLVHER